MLINFINIIYEFPLVSEMYARSGLLSCMINDMFKSSEKSVVVNAYGDNNVINEDSNNSIYYNVKKLTPTLIKNIDKNSMIILNWPNFNKRDNFLKLFMNNRFKCIIVIENQLNYKFVNQKFIKGMISKKYKYIPLFVKQLSCYDYFKYNKHYEDKTCVSMTHIFINSNIEITKEDIILGTSESNYVTKRKKQSTRQIFQDMAIQGKLPLWICNTEDESNSNHQYGFEHLVNLYKNILLNPIYNHVIPTWLSNIHEIKFWCVCMEQNLFLDKFNYGTNFRDYMDKILNLQYKGLNTYKQEQIISDYIISLKEAEKYILLTYLTDDIKYLIDNNSFVTLFNDTWLKYESEKMIDTHNEVNFSINV
jgi:hypothetical protein